VIKQTVQLTRNLKLASDILDQDEDFLAVNEYAMLELVYSK